MVNIFYEGGVQEGYRILDKKDFFLCLGFFHFLSIDCSSERLSYPSYSNNSLDRSLDCLSRLFRLESLHLRLHLEGDGFFKF